MIPKVIKEIVKYFYYPTKRFIGDTIRKGKINYLQRINYTDLDFYYKNIYSQHGEDGILAEIIKRLGIDSGWVVEFGAWDGKKFSNTFNLVTQGFQAVYIEGDQEKYNELKKTADEYKNIHPIKTYIEESGVNSLDNVLENTKCPKDFDVLSIDIDSNDYQIWQCFKNYNPKIVVIEVNSSVALNVEAIYSKETRRVGTSFSSMLKLGNEKGYICVLHTGNMIFARNDLVYKIYRGQQEKLYKYIKTTKYRR